MIHFVSTWDNLLKHYISAKFLLIEGYVPDALRKELHISPFLERFKTAIWEGLADKFSEY